MPTHFFLFALLAVWIELSPRRIEYYVLGLGPGVCPSCMAAKKKRTLAQLARQIAIVYLFAADAELVFPNPACRRISSFRESINTPRVRACIIKPAGER